MHYMNRLARRLTGKIGIKTGIKIARRNVSYIRYADNITLMAESEEELKSFLMMVQEENEKAGLKTNIQKMKVMASGPIISWQIDGEKVEIVTDFIFLGFKITVDGDCSREIQRHLLLWKKAMTNLDSKVGIVQAMFFPTGHVQM